MEKSNVYFWNKTKIKDRNHYTTPKEGWEDILKYIPKDTPLWLPFYNEGQAKNILVELGYNDVYHENMDFFQYDMPDRLVIDNPPYDAKKKIIDKLYKRGKPFALLLPLVTLERKYMKGFLNKFQMIIPAIRYTYVDANTAPPFKSCWFCWGMQEYLNTNDKLIFL